MVSRHERHRNRSAREVRRGNEPNTYEIRFPELDLEDRIVNVFRDEGYSVSAIPLAKKLKVPIKMLLTKLHELRDKGILEFTSTGWRKK